MSLFDFTEHQDRFTSLQNNGWYDPNTRDEIFICDMINYYKRKPETFEYLLKNIPITNNVFFCLHQIENESDTNENILNVVNSCFSKLSSSRHEELANSLKYKNFSHIVF